MIYLVIVIMKYQLIQVGVKEGVVDGLHMNLQTTKTLEFIQM